jgi:hypothetical protein
LKVRQWYVSFSIFPLNDYSLGTKFDMQAPGLKEEKR